MSTNVDLATHLQSLPLWKTRPALCTSLLPALLDSISSIAVALRDSQQVSVVGSANPFGDDQLNVDLVAEDIIRAELKNCSSVAVGSSEENPVERPLLDQNGDYSSESRMEQYSLAWDPLDGSSIIAPNWTVGTIIGVWDGVTALHQSPKEKQIAAILGVCGPRTTAIVALRIPDETSVCFEVGVGFNNAGKVYEVIRPKVELLPGPYKTRYFAPANLRAAADDEKYMQLITHYIQQKYTLRYSGGLVPDVVHALVKGHGIYISPVTSTSKAKLRRLYELAPLALIVECAGGSAIDPTDGQRILERPIESCDDRAGLVCGTKEEVEVVRRALCP